LIHRLRPRRACLAGAQVWQPACGTKKSPLPAGLSRRGDIWDRGGTPKHRSARTSRVVAGMDSSHLVLVCQTSLRRGEPAGGGAAVRFSSSHDLIQVFTSLFHGLASNHLAATLALARLCGKSTRRKCDTRAPFVIHPPDPTGTHRSAPSVLELPGLRAIDFNSCRLRSWSARNFTIIIHKVHLNCQRPCRFLAGPIRLNCTHLPSVCQVPGWGGQEK
jgi:hypothetical protein